MDIKNKNSGFTLIELIFVLAIIGVAITLGLSYTAKLAERSKENITSLQIQQISQAALTYFVEKEKWPNKGNSSSVTAAADFKDYIPAFDRLATTPWGSNNYTWEPDASGGKLFTISTIVPNTDAAARIASPLPNAYNNTTTITSKITIPGQVQKILNGYVISAGEFKVAEDLVDSDCKKEKIFGDPPTSCFVEGHKEVISSQDDKIISCFDKGGVIKIKPNIMQFQLNGIVISGMTFGDFFRIIVSEDLACGNGQYCVYYHVEGDNYLEQHYIYPNNVVVSYMVLCTPLAPEVP